MNKTSLFALCAAAALAAGCAGGSQVGLIDVQRLTANWPQYMNAQNQLIAEQRAISATKGSNAQKASQLDSLQKRYAQVSNQLVDQVRNAAAKVAQQRNLKLIVTRQFVGYGGTDITPDVEKILGIVEKPSPTP